MAIHLWITGMKSLLRMTPIVVTQKIGKPAVDQSGGAHPPLPSAVCWPRNPNADSAADGLAPCIAGARVEIVAITPLLT